LDSKGGGIVTYSKTTWVDGENKYDITTQAGAVIVEDIKLVYKGSTGTPMSATNMNNIEAGIAETFPTGMIAFFAADAPPAHFLECDGAAISRTTYAALFAVIGETFGAGDGSTTFNLPDLRGEFIRGWDNSRGVDSGRVFGSAQAGTQMSSSGSNGAGTLQSAANIENVSETTQSRVSANASGGIYSTFTIRPRNIALLPCIKY
jgi:phage-related tail fiber protein